VRHS